VAALLSRSELLLLVLVSLSFHVDVAKGCFKINRDFSQRFAFVSQICRVEPAHCAF
jgi:hypothetical protein